MTTDRLENLDADACLELLAQNHFGRIAVNDEHGPVVFPVNYVFVEDGIVFRSDEGTKVDAALQGQPASFEIDAVDERTRTGWSVVIRGMLREVTDEHEIANLRKLPLHPFAGGQRRRYIWMSTDDIGGRSIDIPEGVPEGWFRPTGLGHVWSGQDAADMGM